MKQSSKRNWLRDNGLTLVLMSLFLATFAGQCLSGFFAENNERMLEGAPELSAPAYLVSGAFLSSVFENWESEFLQMWAYVMLTAYLFQRGSPESRDPDDDEPRSGDRNEPRSIGQWLYAHSLGLALLALFLVSFLLHWFNSARDAAEQAANRGIQSPTLLTHLGDPQLWFESFQNWQSEFMSTAVLVVLGIFLRERLSPESKAVEESNATTGAG
jgi:hypothetical protein